jgi:hypothetical protein
MASSHLIRVFSSSSRLTRAIARGLVGAQIGTLIVPIAAEARPAPRDDAPPPVIDSVATVPATPIVVNREVPDHAPPPGTWSLSAEPSDEELFRKRVFAEPLVPIGGATTPAENRALARALSVYVSTRQPDAVAPLVDFVDAFPKTPWRASLCLNLGGVYRDTGHYTRALESWDRAWQLSREETDVRAKAIADLAIGEWLFMSASLGRKQAFEEAARQIADRDVSGQAAASSHARTSARSCCQPNRPRRSRASSSRSIT